LVPQGERRVAAVFTLSRRGHPLARLPAHHHQRADASNTRRPPSPRTREPRARLRARYTAPRDARGRARSTALPCSWSGFRSRSAAPDPS